MVVEAGIGAVRGIGHQDAVPPRCPLLRVPGAHDEDARSARPWAPADGLEASPQWNPPISAIIPCSSYTREMAPCTVDGSCSG